MFFAKTLACALTASLLASLPAHAGSRNFTAGASVQLVGDSIIMTTMMTMTSTAHGRATAMSAGSASVGATGRTITNAESVTRTPKPRSALVSSALSSVRSLPDRSPNRTPRSASATNGAAHATGATATTAAATPSSARTAAASTAADHSAAASTAGRATGRSLIGQWTAAANRPRITPSHQTGL